MHLRELTHTDYAQFVALREYALKEYPASFSAANEEEQADRKHKFNSLVSHRVNFILGAFVGEMLVGMVGFMQLSRKKISHKGELTAMIVSAAYQGQGIGYALLQHALEKAFLIEDIHQINLVVNEDRKSAIALYKKVGFVPYGLEKNAIRVEGKMHTAIHMVKRSSSSQH
ncbi:MAG: GNAT family N-acetyltransferase [Bacteroidota bacterium]